MESALTPAFIDSTDHPNSFFDILPADWKEDIEPIWDKYSTDTRIYALELQYQVVGGGLVFSQVSPDTMMYKEEAEKLLEKGLFYFGFLWIDPQHRGKNYGSLWIDQLKKKYENNLWLSIEEKGLMSFYQKNGFRLFKEITLPDSRVEWILVSGKSNLL